MKSKISFLITLWSVIFAFSLGILLLLFGEKESRASERENRMLQGMPALTAGNILSGDFSSEMEGYFCDSFFARNLFINFSEELLDGFSVETVEDTALLEGGDDELQGIDAESGAEPEEDNGESAEDAVIPEDDEIDDEEIGAAEEDISDDSDEAEITETSQPMENADSYGFYFRRKNGKLTNVFKTFPGRRKQIVSTLNKYRKVLPEDGNVFYMMIPLKRNYTPVKKSDSYIGWYSNTEDAMAKLADPGVHIINAPEVLEPHLDESIYFPIDHHWSALGAYYLCEKVITMQGLPMTPYNEYSYASKYGTNMSSGSKGRFDVMYPLQKVTAKKLYSYGEKDSVFIDYSLNTYMAYLGGRTIPWSRYTTGFSTGRKALVIGDSFANVFAPYLCPYYDEIHMTDVRENYYDHRKAGGWIAKLMKKYGIDDVYIIMSYANGANSATSYERLEYCLYGN